MNAPEPVLPVAIVGAGPAGLVAALALARRGCAVTLIGPAPDAADTRTTALLAGSLETLRGLGIDIAASGKAAPLRVMAIVDATRRLIRARPVSFSAVEIGLEAFGWNIANGDLTALLGAALAREAGIVRLNTGVVAAAAHPDHVALTLADGPRIACHLAIAADGRASLIRQSVGIAVTVKTYDQTALALNLRIARPHRETSTEFHTESGPFTLVPLPGERASLVWAMTPAEALRRAALDDPALALEIEAQCGSIHGRVRIDGPRSFWPMTSQKAAILAASRVALIGEAGHVLPPIGAQGFNLTMRDVSVLADLVAGAADPGGEAVLDAYIRARRADVMARGSAVDLLNRSLLSPALLAQGLRGLALYFLEQAGPLRRAAMRQGLAGGDRA